MLSLGYHGYFSSRDMTLLWSWYHGDISAKTSTIQSTNKKVHSRTISPEDYGYLNSDN